MLQQLQFEDQADAVQPKIGAVNLNHWSTPHMRTNQAICAGNALAVNLGKHGGHDNGWRKKSCDQVSYAPVPLAGTIRLMG